MSNVSAAATAHDPEPGEARPEAGVAGGQLSRITRVQLFGLVELGVAQAGRVRAQCANPIQPRLVGPGKPGGYVLRMRAVDHVPGDRRAGRFVDALDRFTERGARG